MELERESDVQLEAQQLEAERKWLLKQIVPAQLVEVGLLIKDCIARLDAAEPPPLTLSDAPSLASQQAAKAGGPEVRRGLSLTLGDRRRLTSLSNPQRMEQIQTSHLMSKANREMAPLHGNVKVLGTKIVSADIQYQPMEHKHRRHSAPPPITTSIRPKHAQRVPQAFTTLIWLQTALQDIDGQYFHDSITVRDMLQMLRQLTEHVQQAKRSLHVPKPLPLDTTVGTIKPFEPPLPAQLCLDWFVNHGHLELRMLQLQVTEPTTSSGHKHRPSLRKRFSRSSRHHRVPEVEATMENATGAKFISHQGRECQVLSDHRATVEIPAWTAVLQDIHTIQAKCQSLIGALDAVA